MSIDVIYIADIERLVQKSMFSATAYYDATSAGQGYVFGLTRWDNINAGPYWPGYLNTKATVQSGVTLNVRAEAGDKIRLRAQSLTAGFKYQCFIQSITCYNANISVSDHQCGAVSTACQAASNAPTPTQTFDDCWELTIGDKPGSDRCTINMAIFDSNATRVGGFFTYMYVTWPGVSAYAIS